MSENWKCEKCGVVIYGAPGPFTKCPSCGHYYEPSAYGKEKCDCEYCKEVSNE